MSRPILNQPIPQNCVEAQAAAHEIALHVNPSSGIKYLLAPQRVKELLDAEERLAGLLEQAQAYRRMAAHYESQIKEEEGKFFPNWDRITDLHRAAHANRRTADLIDPIKEGGEA